MAQQEHHVPSAVLDVLATLPVPLLRLSFWPLLSASAKQHFRDTSLKSRDLARLLTSGFMFGPEPPTQADVGPHVACLSAQEHVQTLKLGPWEEHHLAEALALGTPACRRVEQVVLFHNPRLSAITGQAVAAACPQLRTLILSDVDSLGLDVAFFNQLAGLVSLQKVSIKGTTTSLAAIEALRSLPGLQSLRLGVGRLPVIGSKPCDAPDTPPWDGIPASLSALTQLRSLNLRLSMMHAAVTDGFFHPLHGLSQLTALCIKAEDGAYAYDGLPSSAALAQLGVLHHLVSLRLQCVTARVDPTGWAGLRQLSHLTQLHFRGLRARRFDGRAGRGQRGAFNSAREGGAAPCGGASLLTGGGLQRLRELHLFGFVSGSQLLTTLTPLLPLPQLRELQATVGMYYNEFWQRGAAAQPEAAWRAADLSALQQAAQHLAAAPRLLRVALCLMGTYMGISRHKATGVAAALTACMEALEAVQPRLLDLEVCALSQAQLEVLGRVLAPFSQLSCLGLSGCKLDASRMADVARQVRSLRRLEVGDCKGATAQVAVAIVGAREEPLQVVWPIRAGRDERAMAAMCLAMGKPQVSFVPPGVPGR